MLSDVVLDGPVAIASLYANRYGTCLLKLLVNAHGILHAGDFFIIYAGNHIPPAQAKAPENRTGFHRGDFHPVGIGYDPDISDKLVEILADIIEHAATDGTGVSSSA